MISSRVHGPGVFEFSGVFDDGYHKVSSAWKIGDTWFFGFAEGAPEPCGVVMEGRERGLSRLPVMPLGIAGCVSGERFAAMDDLIWFEVVW